MKKLLRTVGRTLELSRGHAGVGERVAIDRGDVQRAEKLLAPFARDAHNVAALRRFLAEDLEVPRLFALTDAQVVSRVAVALAYGRASLGVPVARARATAGAGAVPHDAPEDERAAPPDDALPAARREREAPPPKTWIEIELLDDLDEPVPHARYTLTLPDGGVRQGRLDAAGRAYVGGIDPGLCSVRFPDLDEDTAA